MYNITNFYQRAIALLASQFRGDGGDFDKNNFQKFLAGIISPCTDVNDTELQLNTMRWLATAQGVQLDELGVILGLPRTPSDRPDDDEAIGNVDVTGYRTLLKFQVFVNKSNGTPEEMIFALKYLTNSLNVKYIDSFPAFYQMRTETPVEDFILPPQEIIDVFQKISPAGVNFAITSFFGNIPPFVFSTDPIVEDFYVAPNPADITEIDPFHVSPDGIADDQFQTNRGQTLSTGLGGGFAEVNYVVPGAGHLAEVLQLT